MTGRLAWVLVICAVAPRLVYAQATPVVTEIRVEQEGRLVDDRVISSLIETRTGEPLSMRDVRETLSHLTSLNRFEDVQVFQEAAGAGVRLRYVLLPLHPVDRIEFRGVLGKAPDSAPILINYGHSLRSGGKGADATAA